MPIENLSPVPTPDSSDDPEATDHSQAELREARQQVHEANLKLRQASRAKDEFLAAVSHELRTPLNVILGNSEMILGGLTGRLSSEALDSVRMIHQSGQNLLSLVNRILDLSLLQANKLEIQPRVVPFWPILETVLGIVMPLADPKKIPIEISIDPELNYVSVDEIRFRQILTNLLSNAIKFTPNGRAIGLIGETLPYRNLIRLTIWDEGIGIKEEEQQLLFEPFVQADSGLNRRYEGTGLGLPLVRGLVELHRGEINVMSHPDQGARVEILLPWPLDAQKNLPPPDPYSTEMARDGRSGWVSPANLLEAIGLNQPKKKSRPERDPEGWKAHILLAEDNPANQTILQTFLSRHEYHVEVAMNGREALEKVDEHLPDLILMDVQMPEMDGLEATRILRRREATCNLPIITITGMAMTADRERCLEAGADHHVRKPFELADLLRLIEACLDEGLSG